MKLVKSNNYFVSTNETFFSKLFLHLFLKNFDVFLRIEKIYLSSIYFNLEKLERINLDVFCALDELHFCLVMKITSDERDKHFLQTLRVVDKRIRLNRNSSHLSFIEKLPLFLRYILDEKFIWTFATAVAGLFFWFAQTYFHMITGLLSQLLQMKLTIAMVLYTDLYLNERVALFSTLADNPILIKALQIYYTQFSFNFVYLKTVFFVLCEKTSFENRRDTLWNLFKIHLDIKETITDSIYDKESIISKIGSFFSSFMQKEENVVRTAMSVARGGKVPTFDIYRLNTLVKEINFQGEYMYDIFSKFFLVFCGLVFLHILIYLFCWWKARETKKKLLNMVLNKKD